MLTLTPKAVRSHDSQHTPDNTVKNTPHNNQDDPETKMEIQLSTAIQTALTCPFSSAEDYLSVLSYSCDFRRRALKRRLLAVTQGEKGEGEEGLKGDVRGVRRGILAGVAGLRQVRRVAAISVSLFDLHSLLSHTWFLTLFSSSPLKIIIIPSLTFECRHLQTPKPL